MNTFNRENSYHLGSPEEVFSPLYWKFIADETNAIQHRENYKLGYSLLEETVVCLLGGHGIKGEIGNSFFEELKKSGVLNQLNNIEVDDIKNILIKPIEIRGRPVKYRFPEQKAKYIHSAISYISTNDSPKDCGKELRNWLLNINGVGLKTASWIARNWLDCDDVAILDIHIHRAGVIMGIFSPNQDIQKYYLDMESSFLHVAQLIDVPAAVLDNLIWTELRQVPLCVRKLLMDKNVKPNHRCGLPTSNNRHTNATYELFAQA